MMLSAFTSPIITTLPLNVDEQNTVTPYVSGVSPDGIVTLTFSEPMTSTTGLEDSLNTEAALNTYQKPKR